MSNHAGFVSERRVFAILGRREGHFSAMFVVGGVHELARAKVWQ